MTAEDGPASELRRHSNAVAAGILLSRVAGLVREKLTAYYLGAGLGADAFRAALRIPNLLQNLLGEGVLSASFVPSYSKLLADGRDRDAGRLAGAVAGLLTVVAGTLVLVGVLFAAPLTRVIAPGFPPGSDKFDLTVTMVRILTPGVGFLVLSAWCLGILNSHRRFFLSYVAPVLWNAAIVGSLVTVALFATGERTLATALAWGAFAGSVLQLAVQLPVVVRLSRGLRLSTSPRVPGVRTVIGAFGPVLAGRGVVQVSAYVDLLLASLLAAGAVAALGYAQVLYLLPISLFGMSIAAAELPALSTMDHDDRAAVTARLEAGLGRVAFFVVPGTVAYLLLGDLVVATLYQGNRFTPDDTAQVTVVLVAYTLGLLASTSSRLLQSALYGVGDTRRPAMIAAGRVVLSTAVGVALMLPLDRLRIDASFAVETVGDVTTWAFAGQEERLAADNQRRLGAVGLAFGAAVGAWVELALLRRTVRRTLGTVRLGGTRLGRVLLAGVGAVAGAAGGRLLAVTVLSLPALLAGPVALAVCGAGYLAAARRLGLPEARELRLPRRGPRSS